MSNKKGMMDDLFDFLFTVFLIFFIMAFIGYYIEHGNNLNERAAINLVEKTELVDNYILEQRINLNNNLDLEYDAMKSRIQLLRVSFPEVVLAG